MVAARLLLLVQCGVMTGCPVTKGPTGPSGPPLAHAEFTGKVTLSLTGTRDDPLTVEMDECDGRRVRLRIGPTCALAGAWMGEPAGHGAERPDEWRVGTMSIAAGSTCTIDLPNGHAALRVDGGSAQVQDELLRVHVTGAGSAESFDFVGVLAAKRGPTACTP